MSEEEARATRAVIQAAVDLTDRLIGYRRPHTALEVALIRAVNGWYRVTLPDVAAKLDAIRAEFGET